MFGILEAASVAHEAVYNTYEDLILDLNKRMERQGYKIVKTRSHRRKPGGPVEGNEIVRCDLNCDRGGRPYKCLATKHKTKTKKTDCPWKAKAVHRSAVGGWVLTILCDQHNHEAGTPEPPTPVAVSDAEDDGERQTETALQLGPQPDPDTSVALQVAGVSNSALRLTGDTFHQFKTEYRKMTQTDRLNILAQLQLRVAAIYAVQNEDLQRQTQQRAQDWRHREIDANRKALASQRHRARRQQDTNRVNRSGQIQQLPNTAAPGPQVLPQELVAPCNTTMQAPEAPMQEPHFQLADPAEAATGLDLPQFHQFTDPL